MFSLQNKIAFVTGGASGIGAALAEVFARAAQLYGSPTAMKKMAGQRLNASSADSCSWMLPMKMRAPGPRQRWEPWTFWPTSLASVTWALSPNTTAADLDRLHAVNVRGVFNSCKAFVPAMLERKSGSVINMASIAGIVAVRERLAYTTTKFAVVGLTKALALDHSHTGVRFNCICPGRVETPFVQARIKEYPDPQAAYRDMASTQLNGRMAKPEEIAAAAVYLASDESSMVTGSTLMIDGGWSAGK